MGDWMMNGVLGLGVFGLVLAAVALIVGFSVDGYLLR
jgi:hypothetical protein